MKRTGNLSTLRGDCSLLLLLTAALVFLCATDTRGSTASNPYSGIVERNTFGLKPPVNPADLVKPPPPVVADIKIEGFSTILGRKQVMLNVKVPAKPPEPARNQSLLFVEGQREGEVEVVEIHPAEETVKVNNAGNLLALNLKDHGQKPTPGAAVPAAPGLPPGRLPGAVPPPAAPAIPTASVPTEHTTTVESFGGNKTIPTPIPARALRSGTESGMTVGAGGVNSASTAASSLNSQVQAAAQRSPEENVILFEANRLRRQQSGSGFLTGQQHPALGGAGPGGK